MNEPIYADRCLVLGMGSSGTAAAKLLLARGAEVTAVDRSDRSGDLRLIFKRGEPIRFIWKCGRIPAGEFDLCVVSPGVSSDSPLVREASDRGIRIVSELELGWSHLDARVIGITGTNGKSTAVKLCAEMIAAGGMTSVAAGNYGRPLSDVALHGPVPEWVVAEVSSFQLEYAGGFAPHLAVLLNIGEDHLDRHSTPAEYAALKCRIFENMPQGSTAVIDKDAAGACPATVRDKLKTLITGASEGCNYCCESDRVVSGGRTLQLAGTAFEGEVMGRIAASVWAVADHTGVDRETLERSIRSFVMLPHRMETVGSKDGRRFINDSKATNLAALSAALKMCSGGVRLIAGGVLKEGKADKIEEFLEMYVKTAYVIGRDAEVLISCWQDVVECRKCLDMAEAVRLAWEESAVGDTILLSPGAASFDAYQNFEQRGDDFKRYALEIIQKEGD
ncbi:MAG: UDP-N-acetylmuramoyl-L-alanine--D-glutamate ligase [Verrucomicrobiota bacterium]